MRALRTSDAEDDERATPEGGAEGLSVVTAPGGVPSGIRLPRLTVKEAQALSVISRRAVDCLITPVDGRVHAGNPDALAHSDNAVLPDSSAWRVTLSAGRSDAVAAACTITAHLNWSGARLRVRLPSRAVMVWLTSRLQMDIDDAAYDASPDERAVRDAALEAMLGEVLDRLALSGLGKPELIATETAGETAAEGIGLHHWLAYGGYGSNGYRGANGSPNGGAIGYGYGNGSNGYRCHRSWSQRW